MSAFSSDETGQVPVALKLLAVLAIIAFVLALVSLGRNGQANLAGRFAGAQADFGGTCLFGDFFCFSGSGGAQDSFEGDSAVSGSGFDYANEPGMPEAGGGFYGGYDSGAAPEDFGAGPETGSDPDYGGQRGAPSGSGLPEIYGSVQPAGSFGGVNAGKSVLDRERPPVRMPKNLPQSSEKSGPKAVAASFEKYSSDYPPECKEHCPSVTVFCLPEGQLADECGEGATACADEASCEISLLDSACGSAGISSGTYPAGEIEDILNDAKEKSAPGPDEAEDICTLEHEFRHICDPDDRPPGSRQQCTEVYAEVYEDKCMNDFAEANCGENQNWTDEQCGDLCGRIEYGNYVRKWDDCMCQNAVSAEGKYSTGSTGSSDCCSCISQCTAYGDNMAMPQACIDKGFVNQKDAQSACAGISKAGSGHGCDYWSSDEHDEAQIFGQCGGPGIFLGCCSGYPSGQNPWPGNKCESCDALLALQVPVGDDGKTDYALLKTQRLEAVAKACNGAPANFDSEFKDGSDGQILEVCVVCNDPCRPCYQQAGGTTSSCFPKGPAGTCAPEKDDAALLGLIKNIAKGSGVCANPLTAYMTSMQAGPYCGQACCADYSCPLPEYGNTTPGIAGCVLCDS